MRVFISHSSIDKKFVRTLKDDLQQNGIQTWLDEDELEYGDSLIEKLQNALEESSHFVIVLSQNSVNSDWVKYELNKAKLLKNNSVLKKIIPIKYRECDIPQDLIGFIYGDLSSEVVLSDNDKIKFVSDGYPKFFNKLIKTLKSTDNLLTEKDKLIFKGQNVTNEEKGQIILPEVNLSDLKDVTTLRFYLKVVRYSNMESLNLWRQKVKSESVIPKISNMPLIKINPIILPTMLRLYKETFKMGDSISFKSNNIYKQTGHFAGFKTKSDTYTITISGTVRKYLSIESNKIYLFEFNLQTHEINIVGG